MPRRVTLVALWVVFAVASVSVGFAAAGLVSDPFTDVGTNTDVSTLAGPGEAPVTEPGSPTTGTATPSTPTSTPKTGTATPSQPGTTRPPDPRTPSSTTSSAPTTVKGGISTRGGYVSGTCRDGLVSVGAAPAVWWQVDSITSGRVRTARVRLEPAKDANGERVEVTVTCAGGRPAFHTEYKDGGGDDGGGDDSGGDDGGGGSGGSYDDGGGDSSGPGSG